MSRNDLPKRLIETLEAVLRHQGTCPECHMNVGHGQLHGVSQVFPGEDCHLDVLLIEAHDREWDR